MELATYLLIAAAVAAGVVGAVARVWSIHSRLYSLEDRLSLVEGILTREVKVRAATERWKRPSRDEERIAEALANLPPPPTQKKNWWEVDLPRSVEQGKR